MYGTIAKLRVKPGHVGGLKLVMEGSATPPGAVAIYGYEMDANPNEVWLAVVFESKEAYVANANSPEQHQRYLEMMAYLEAEPEWHDGGLLFSKTI
ncbi:MAG: hypothetical protein HYX94_06335 [Chloroflexi bacterium]|nr:hypothetical protein [Chloroflexota bacterium]